MAHIVVPAFGTSMIFRVPEGADMDGFFISSVRSRADVQAQLNDYLSGLGYNTDEYYKW